MKSFEIQAELREQTGKSNTRKLRKEKKVPCVVYGGQDPLHVAIEARSLKDLVYTPHVYLVDLKVGDDTHRCIMQDLQFHPVTDDIQHIDFLSITDDKEVKISIPVEFTGLPKGVTQGGKLFKMMRYLHVKALAKDLPDSITIDISDLAVGDSVLIEDLKYDNLTIVDPASQQIVAVRSSRSISLDLPEEEGEGEESEEAEGSEEEESNE